MMMMMMNELCSQLLVLGLMFVTGVMDFEHDADSRV